MWVFKVNVNRALLSWCNPSIYDLPGDYLDDHQDLRMAKSLLFKIGK